MDYKQPPILFSQTRATAHPLVGHVCIGKPDAARLIICWRARGADPDVAERFFRIRDDSALLADQAVDELGAGHIVQRADIARLAVGTVL